MIYHRASFLFYLFFFSAIVSGQIVKGKILDVDTDEPIPYMAIVENNTSYSAITDMDGLFLINVNDIQRVSLSFSHLGYERRSLSFGKPMNDTLIVVKMQSNVHALEDVEVFASPFRQTLTESFSHTKIEFDVIEEKIATSLIDVLEEVPGITKRAEYHSAIALRGLGGKRILITKDGNRRMGNFPSGFMGQGVNIYDLEKVEVIKGPASVKYGPCAISGIINMVSKQPFLKPGWHGKAISSFGLNNNEKTIMTGINYAGIDHALSLSGRFRDADNFHCGNREVVNNTQYRDKDIHLSYSWEGNGALMITSESDLHLGGTWGQPVGFNGTQYMKVYNPIDNTWHSSLTAVYHPEQQCLRRVETSLYLDKEKRQQLDDSYDVGTGLLSYRENVCFRNYYYGWRALSVFAPSKFAEVTVGTDGVCFRIESPTELTDYFLSSTISNRVTKDAGVALGGLFVEMEQNFWGDLLKLRAGIRVDYSNINEGDVHDTTITQGRNSHLWAWNSTAGAVYRASDKVFVSFQAARSCRMPDATEMFIVSSNADGMIYGNSNLIPEYGLNFDAGIRGNINVLTFDCSLFGNFLRDFITLRYWLDSGKKGINYKYANIDRARIYGAELSLGAKWIHVFHPDNRIIYNGTYVFTQGDNLTKSQGCFVSGIPLHNIPPFNTNQNLTYRRMLSSAASLYCGGDIRYYATQKRIAPSSDGGYISPGYCLFGASAGLTYRRHGYVWDLKLKGDNLANNKYRPFESLVNAMGRNVKVMLSVGF